MAVYWYTHTPARGDQGRCVRGPPGTGAQSESVWFTKGTEENLWFPLAADHGLLGKQVIKANGRLGLARCFPRVAFFFHGYNLSSWCLGSPR